MFILCNSRCLCRIRAQTRRKRANIRKISESAKPSAANFLASYLDCAPTTNVGSVQNQHSFVWIYPNNRCNTLIARHMHPIRTHSPTDRRTGASSGCLPNAESFLSVSTEKLPSVDGTFLRFEQQDTAIPHPYKVRPLTRLRLGISPSCHGRACRRATHSRSVSLGLSGRNRHPPPPCRRDGINADRSVSLSAERLRALRQIISIP